MRKTDLICRKQQECGREKMRCPMSHNDLAMAINHSSS